MGILDYLGGKYDEYKQSEMPLAYLLRGDYQGFPEAYKQNAINSSYGLLTDTMEGKNLPIGGILGTTKLYHGTSPEAAKRILKEGFDVSKSADNTGWFTTNKSIGDNVTTGKGAVLESSIDESKLKLAGWDEIDKYSIDELINKGYDGVKMTDNGETVYQMFYPEKMQLKVLK